MNRIMIVLCLFGLFSCANISKVPSASDHFDGTMFHNRQNPRLDTLVEALKVSWELLTKKKNWPEKFQTPAYRISGDPVVGGIRISFIGHATVLIQTPQLNIITDPVLFDFIGPNSFLKIESVTNPGVVIESLPRIDVILISHNHFDHLDVKSIKKIVERQPSAPPAILVGLGVGTLLRENGIVNYLEMDWDQWHDINGVKIHFLESVHTSRRGLFDTNRTLWGAFMIEAIEGKIYFAGDTAFGEQFRKVYETFGSPTLSLLPIGAYKPRWFMQKEHVNPEEA